MAGIDTIQQTAGDKSSEGLVSIDTGHLTMIHTIHYSISTSRDPLPWEPTVDPTYGMRIDHRCFTSGGSHLLDD